MPIMESAFHMLLDHSGIQEQTKSIVNCSNSLQKDNVIRSLFSVKNFTFVPFLFIWL